MTNEIFMAAVKRLTEQNCSVSDAITTAESMKKQPGGGDLASQFYSLWLQLNPNDPMLQVVYFNMAVTLSDAGKLEEAKQALEKCIAIAPDFYPPYINLGTLLERMGNASGAVMQWNALASRLAAVNGQSVTFKAMALKQIARVLEMNLHITNAEQLLKQSLEIDAAQMDVVQHYIALRLQQCEWPIVQPWDGVGREALLKSTGPLSMLVYTDDPLLQLGSAWNYNRNFVGYSPVDFQQKHRDRAGTRPKKLRIGYVSSDLRHHAIGFIMAEMFEHHDRSKFEVFAYYCGIPHEDDLKTRIKATIDQWVDVREMSDEAMAQRILDDKIDLLIDVNGYTKDARTKVFAMRPAPIIVNWLGYPGSMGSPYHHYIIADEWIIPQGSEHYYSEKVMRLPCYQPNDRKRKISAHKPTRAEVGLPEKAFVFCSFNGVQKISRFTFDRWMQILVRVPDSVLWLLEGNHESIKDRLRAAASERGIAPERIIFAKKSPNHEHLARYPLADLFLDNSPYGAHVTASDALWMGVPIVTFPGRGFASRVCSSLVRAAGIPEMVCDTPAAFVEKAVALAQNPSELSRIRKKLADNRDRSMLFDTESLVRHLEGLYEEMWQEYAAGELPQPDLTNLETYLDIGVGLDHDATEMLNTADYPAHYLNALEKRHSYCPLAADARIWTEARIEALNEKNGITKKSAKSTPTLTLYKKKS